jgi:FKBP-type peptidyl-prolyl cis-trans isomerase (trigger factor)
MMIICAVAQKEGIEITDENFDAELELYAQENNLGTGEVLKSQYQTNYLKLSMIYDRVLKKLQEYGKPVEPETETLETVPESE